MAKQSASLRVAAPALSEAMHLALALAPKSEGQIVAQREIVVGLENAMDARGGVRSHDLLRVHCRLCAFVAETQRVRGQAQCLCPGKLNARSSSRALDSA
jgi:hypothetical protein